MATATNARKVQRTRPVAPQATTPAEVPAKASIWTRIKSAAKTVGTTIAKPFKAAARAIVPATKKAATAVANTAKAAARSVASTSKKVAQFVQPATNKVVVFAQRLWARGLRTLLRTMLGCMLAVIVLLGLMVAPLTTLITLVLVTGGLFAFAAVLNALEDREATSRAARITLQVLNAIAYFVRGAVYGFAALATLAMMSVSLSFSVFVVGSLIAAYYDSAFGMFLAFAASCVISGSWAILLLDIALFGIPSIRKAKVAAETQVPEYSEIRRKPEVHETVVIRPTPDAMRVRLAQERRRKGMAVRPSDAPNNPELWTRGNHLVAKGTEELWGTEHDVPAEGAENWSGVWQNDTACEACGTHEGALRVRSMNVPFVTVGPNKGTPKEVSDGGMLCSACFDAECEDVALALTGVSLKARSTEVRLNKTGVEHAPEFAASKFEPEKFFWLESGWWRDKHDTQYPREWTCFVDGKVVLSVVHDHKRKVYRASVLGRLVPNGVKKTLAEAQRSAEAEYEDEDRAVERIEQAASEIAGEAPRRAKKG